MCCSVCCRSCCARSIDAPSDMRVPVTFKILCDNTNVGDEIYVVGSITELGLWNTNSAVQLSTSTEIFPLWRCSVSLAGTGGPFEYKFAKKNRDGRWDWENIGDSKNRHGEIHHATLLDCGTFGSS